MKPAGMLAAIVMILTVVVALSQEKPRIISRDKIEQRVQAIQKQISAENEYLKQLLDPVKRDKLVSASIVKIQDWTNVLDGLLLSVGDTTLSTPDSTQAPKKK